MKDFTIKCSMKLGKVNIELEFKGNNEEEFKTTVEKLKEEYIPFISNTKNKPIKSKNNSSKKKSNITNNYKKKLNSDCSRIKLNIDDTKLREWNKFYTDNIKPKKYKSYEKVTMLLYWIRINKIDIKVNKNTIFTLFFGTGDKVLFSVKDAINNAQREGNAYIKNDDTNGFMLDWKGEELATKLLNDSNEENAR